MVQLTMTAADAAADPIKRRFVTIAVPRDALAAAMATAAARPVAHGKFGVRLVGDDEPTA
jgi:hypothetical protein